MNAFSAGPAYAQWMDENDPLAQYREAFAIADPNLIYLDGNSLGRLPKKTEKMLQEAVRDAWGTRLIRAWNEGWIESDRMLGAKIAKLVGAQADEILVTEGTSINLFKLATAALKARPNRKEIVSDVLNFPSDLYILQGIIDMLDNQHTLRLIPSSDSIHIKTEDMRKAINGETALVSLSHVAFKSAFMYDMKRVTDIAHKNGALMLWDLCHSVGAVPVDLNASGVDLAVGCTYKYLNGGPGSPAFLYVRRELQEKLIPPMWGWFAADKPFDFNLNFQPATDISRFRVGTLPMLSLLAIEPGIDVLLEATMEAVRAKSVQQTQYMIALAKEWLFPYGFTLGTPEDPSQRGSHVSLRHTEGYRINCAMVAPNPPAVQVIPDFRAPDNIRMGIAPLYTRFIDLFRGMERVREIMRDRLYENYSQERQTVT